MKLTAATVRITAYEEYGATFEDAVLMDLAPFDTVSVIKPGAKKIWVDCSTMSPEPHFDEEIPSSAPPEEILPVGPGKVYWAVEDYFKVHLLSREEAAAIRENQR